MLLFDISMTVFIIFGFSVVAAGCDATLTPAVLGARVGADETLFWGVEVIMDSTFAGTVGVGVMVTNFVDTEGIAGLLVEVADVADETFAIGCGLVADGV